MFRRIFKLNNFNIQNPNFYNNKYLSYQKQSFNYKFNEQLNKYYTLNDFKNNLTTKNSKDSFMNLNDFLEDLKNNINDSDIISIKKDVDNNFELINFNEYDYHKHEFLKTDFLTAYMIIWNKNAETKIHSHPSNGCFIYNLSGKWQETIYNSNKHYNRILFNNDIGFIDNKIGTHKVKFLPSNLDNFGISMNIYSPTCEIN